MISHFYGWRVLEKAAGTLRTALVFPIFYFLPVPKYINFSFHALRYFNTDVMLTYVYFYALLCNKRILTKVVNFWSYSSLWMAIVFDYIKSRGAAFWWRDLDRMPATEVREGRKSWSLVVFREIIFFHKKNNDWTIIHMRVSFPSTSKWRMWEGVARGSYLRTHFRGHKPTSSVIF